MHGIDCLPRSGPGDDDGGGGKQTLIYCFLLLHFIYLFIREYLFSSFVFSFSPVFFGCVCVNGVHITQGFSFQIGYCETDDQLPGRSLPQYTLYLVVANEKERVDWIRAIRAGKHI